MSGFGFGSREFANGRSPNPGVIMRCQGTLWVWFPKKNQACGYQLQQEHNVFSPHDGFPFALSGVKQGELEERKEAISPGVELPPVKQDWAKITTIIYRSGGTHPPNWVPRPCVHGSKEP